MRIIIETIKNHWVGFIPVLLLIVVALNQMYLHNVDYLNRWKGGGFGMFSTVVRRYFHIHLMYKGGFECAEPHIELKKQFDKISNYPKYLALEKLTRKLNKNIWVYSFNSNNIKPTSVRMIGSNENLMAEHKIANFEAVEIQVFDVDFNRSTFSLEPKILRKIKFLK